MKIPLVSSLESVNKKIKLRNSVIQEEEHDDHAKSPDSSKKVCNIENEKISLASYQSNYLERNKNTENHSI